MKKLGLFASSALRSVAFVSLIAAGATPALAQDDTDEAPVATDAPTEDAIVVVGSRIRRNQYNSAEGIQVLNRDEYTQRGFNSSAEVLQSAIVTGGSAQLNNSFAGFVVNGGEGANTIGLRGLGPSRTLVLLNGRRVSPAGSRGSVGSADLNVLPSAMIERIEILNSGASSIYGSDAIAGVINLTTRTNIEGIIAEGQHNVSARGGGNSERYSIVFGHRGDRFQFAGSLEYYNRDILEIGDRDWLRCQTSYRLSGPGAEPGSGDFIDPLTGEPECYGITGTGDSGTSINAIGTPNQAGNTVALGLGVPDGYTGVCNRFRPNPTAGGALPGYECVGGGTIALGVRDTFPSTILSNSLIDPARIYTGFFQGSYQIGALGDAEVYAELLVNRRKSNQVTNRQFTLDYPFGSPLIPVSLRFATPFQTVTAGSTAGNQPIGIRAFTDGAALGGRQRVDFVRATAGLRGDLFGGWRYDLYASKAWSDSEYYDERILLDRAVQSLDVVELPGGGFACRDTSGGCVPAPALTPDVVSGFGYTGPWRDYIVAETRGSTTYRERTLNATVDGPLFRLPGGMVQAVVGVEHRSASIADIPSEESQANNLLSFASAAITQGRDSVWEAFGEVELPLLRNLPFVHELTLNGSIRYTEYESYGGQETWKLGGLFAPTSWLSFRGSYGTSYRAPALFEQFLGASSGFSPASNDPCNNLGAAGQNQSRVDRCRGEGLPDGFQQTGSITVIGLGGAESGLAAETSRNWTVGGVLQPDLGSGFGSLSFAVDYFDLKIDDGVTSLGAVDILNTCYDSGELCELITRSPTGARNVTVISGYVNISTAILRGFDFNLRYSRDLGPGRLNFTAAVTKFNERSGRTLPTAELEDAIGSVNNPEWTGTFDLSYAVDRWNLRYGLEWLDGTYSTAEFLDGSFTNPGVRDLFLFETPDYFLHSASVRYQADRFGITLGVRNLTDVEPPQISSGFYNRRGNAPLYSGYDYLGRTFFINVSTSFR